MRRRSASTRRIRYDPDKRSAQHGRYFGLYGDSSSGPSFNSTGHVLKLIYEARFLLVGSLSDRHLLRS